MKLIIYLLLMVISFSLLTSCQKEENGTTFYKNPISLEDEWEGYGLGDPYILKYNGKYYLYVSTRDREFGIKVWSSTNLVDWEYEGLCTEDPITTTAYAPEVIYWNGYFYMYTSPAGQGHYILKSDSPTGPFEVVTDNLGHSIDGSVFIDDDGQMYFSYAGDSGIRIAKMKDPVTLGESVTTDAYMNGWTEGPTIFKRNGKYYMTYTGNHVFSNAYRIDYAVSDEPMRGYKPVEINPIVINSEGPIVGLGHNSVVKGPDLDTDYIIYHNLEGPGIIGPLRHMNMDIISWNGDIMRVLGPTYTEQPAPRLPDFEDRFNRKRIGFDWKVINGGKWKIEREGFLNQIDLVQNKESMIITKQETESNYTAEFHGKLSNDESKSMEGLYGVVFSYKNEDHFAAALFNPSQHSLDIFFLLDGEVIEKYSAKLPSEFNFSKLHQIRVEKNMNNFKIYVDGMLQKEFHISGFAGGSIGYYTKGSRADFGYTAFSNHVNGSAIWDIYKPIPGTFEAVHYMSGDEGYHVNNKDINPVYREDPVVIVENQYGGYSVNLKQSGDWLKYKVNIAESGIYNLDLRLSTTNDPVVLRIWQDEEDLTGEIKIANTGGLDREATITIKDIHLKEGFHEIKLEVLQGEIVLSTLTFYESHQFEPMATDFTNGPELEWNMYESIWSAKNGIFKANEGDFSKVVVGQTGWTDYVVKTDVRLTKEEGQAGIMVRVQNPANGAERNQNNPDFNQGYFAYIQTDGIYLAKQNFGREILEHVPLEIFIEKWYELKVQVNGMRIQVYLNDSAEPIIDFVDSSIKTFTHGKVGLLTIYDRAEFDNFSVTEYTK